jgi:hypothetical protein
MIIQPADRRAQSLLRRINPIVTRVFVLEIFADF